MDSTTGQLLYKQLIEIIDPKQETQQPAKTQNKERTHNIFDKQDKMTNVTGFDKTAQ